MPPTLDKQTTVRRPAVPPGIDREAFSASIEQLVHRFSRKDVECFEVARFVNGLFCAQRRFRIRSSVDFALTICSLLVF